MSNLKSLINKLVKLSKGTMRINSSGRSYLLTKTTFNNENSMKVLIEELGSKSSISFNLYKLSNEYVLKPCETSSENVEAVLSDLFYSS